VPYLSASEGVIHYKEALYQVYAPLPLPSSQFGFLRGVSLAIHLASIDNLTGTTTRQNKYKLKLTIHKRSLIKQQQNEKIYESNDRQSLV